MFQLANECRDPSFERSDSLSEDGGGERCRLGEAH